MLLTQGLLNILYKVPCTFFVFFATHDKNDEQSQQIKYLIENFDEKYVLKKICGLNENDPLIDFCLKQTIKI